MTVLWAPSHDRTLNSNLRRFADFVSKKLVKNLNLTRNYTNFLFQPQTSGAF